MGKLWQASKINTESVLPCHAPQSPRMRFPVQRPSYLPRTARIWWILGMYVTVWSLFVLRHHHRKLPWVHWRMARVHGGDVAALKLGASCFDDGHLNQTRKLIWHALGALGIISQFHVTSQHCLVGPTDQIQLLRCFANLRHICQRATEVVFRIWKVCQEHSNATGNTCQMCIKWKKGREKTPIAKPCPTAL